MSEPRCVKCGQEASDRRGGFCWNCANDGERTAYHRTCWQHLLSAWGNARRGRFKYARIDLRWCMERLMRSGDYAPGGYFEREHGRL